MAELALGLHRPDIYKLNTVSIPTNKQMLRKDLNDQIFRTEKEKYHAITNKIIECNKKGQPVLVGTTSIEKSEKISNFLDSKKIKHNVLNAKQYEKEAHNNRPAFVRRGTAISFI